MPWLRVASRSSAGVMCSDDSTAMARLYARAVVRGWIFCLLVVVIALAACGGKAEEPAVEAPPSIQLQSDAFAAGQPIPRRYTCDGDDTSPPLAWSRVPKTAKSLALLM